jgi:hypothetical protein
MSELSFRNLEIARPSGSLYEILAHPLHHETNAIELATFNDHRYAFFFWNKWLKEIKKKDTNASAPALVSLDWHQDLVYPCDAEKEWLQALNLKSNGDVFFFSWAKLNPLNDGHIMSAAYLNLIGNVYVNCRQGKFEDDWLDESIEDIHGNVHVIKKYREFSKLEISLLNGKEESVFFDIDLDLFTIKNGLSDGKFKFTYLSDKTINEYLSPERPLIKWIFERLAGFTIALEPEHTGGLLKSNKYLAMIDKLYFKQRAFFAQL